jgi:hypothetical protein
MTLTQAIAELAALAGPRSTFIDMSHARHVRHRSPAHEEIEWTITVMGYEAEAMQQFSAPTLDEAMTAARAALRPVAVPDAVAAADGAMAVT